MKYIFTIICSLLVMAGTMSADNDSLRKVGIANRTFYVYKVKKGDTMYGLSRKYDWNQDTLSYYNHDAISPLAKETLLYYPIVEENAGSFGASSLNTGSKERTDNIIYHNIERGETLSGIARMYGVSLENLYTLNPGSRNGIKEGERLIITKDGIGYNEGSDFRYHTVKPGETLYKLSKQYHVSVETILELNPGVSEYNFKSGSVVRIPASGTGIQTETKFVTVDELTGFKAYKVKKSDTWASISNTFGITEDILKLANPGIELKKNEVIGIPVLTPRTYQQQVEIPDTRINEYGDIREVYNDVHGVVTGDSVLEIRIAMLMDDPSSRKDTEFLRGFLTGIDKLKNTGMKINFKVINASKNISNIKGELDSFEPSLIVTTAERQLPEWVGEYASAQKIPTINTFDVKNEDYQTNPYMIQLITPSDYFNDKIASWIKDKYEDYALVFVGEKDKEDALAESLRKIWDKDKVREREVADLLNLPLMENGKYLMYSYPVKRAEVQTFLNAVSSAKERAPLAEVTIIGRPNWIVFEDTMEEKFKETGVLIPSRFYMEKDGLAELSFQTAYRQLFDRQLLKSFPVYGLVGYDTALYFLNGLEQSGGDINNLRQGSGLIQSDYSLERPTNWSGMVNTAIFMVSYSPWGTDKTVIK